MTIYAAVIGTGFAARKRVEALLEIPQVNVLAVASRSLERSQQFGLQHQIPVCTTADLWQDLNISLVFVCTVNSDHGHLVQRALESNKNVVVEYPLALDIQQAVDLISLARQRQCLLHVEHIELIGGLHLAMQQRLAAIGTPHYVHYRTLAPKHPAPKKWSYQSALLGFPLMAALSRIQRLTDLFGPVDYVTCDGGIEQDTSADHFRCCLYSAQLRFCNGLLAELTYGKGEGLWRRSRYIEVRGDQGCLIFDGNQGTLTTVDGEQSITAAPRQGLFQKDTRWVVDHLLTNKPLYVQPEESLYSLQVAAALQRSVELGKRVQVID